MNEGQFRAIREELQAVHRELRLLRLATAPIAALELPARALRAFENAGLHRVNEVMYLSDAELLALPGFGPACLEAVQAALRKAMG